jgi:hypothetical protein
VCAANDLITSIVSVSVPYVCPVFNMWLEFPDLLLLFLIVCICSLSIGDPSH